VTAGSDRYAALTEMLRASVERMWNALGAGLADDADAG
jgi:hypothetical protein